MVSRDMTESTPTPSPSHLKARLSRIILFVAVLGLVAAYLLIIALASAPLAASGMRSGWLPLVLVVLATTGFVIIRKRFRPTPWTWIGGAYLAVTPVLVYLAVDDTTLRHHVSMEEIAPAFPGAENSYEVLMRYGKDHPLGRNFREPQRMIRNGFPDPAKPTEWRAWLLANREAIEADWVELEPVRAWWEELNTFDRIGDLTPARADAEIMAFQPVRSYSQHAAAIASLQAIDGRGDDAMATMLTLLEVSRKLEPSSRSLVRFMLARVMQNLALKTAAFILDTTRVSAAARSRLLTAVTGGSGGEAGARRLVAVDHVFIVGAFFENGPLADVSSLFESAPANPGSMDRNFRRRVLIPVFRVFSPLVINRNRTRNLLGDLNHRMQDHAARREIDRLERTRNEFRENEGRPRFKNLAGGFIIQMAVPAVSKVVESYWKIEDTRVKLRERLLEM